MEELSVAFINFINDITAPFWTLLWVAGLLVSLVWVMFLIGKMQRSTVPGMPRVSFGEVAAVSILAALLANYSGSLSSVSQSLGFGDVSFGPIAYVQSGGKLGQFAGVINAALTFATMMGGLFGFKGLHLLKMKAEGESRGGDLALQGIIHIIAGGLLVQIAKLLSSVSESIS